MNVYGNTYWQKTTDNKDLSVILMQKTAFDKLQSVLENSGLNYCAYEKNGAVKMAVNDKDLGTIKSVMGDIIKGLNISKSGVEHTPPDKNIFGNSEYKYIPKKSYFSADSDTILKMADLLDKSGVSFSGRVYSADRATLTVTADDLQKVKDLYSDVVKMRNSISKVPRSANREIIGNISYKDIKNKKIIFSTLKPKDYKEIQPYLNSYGISYSGVMQNGRVTFSVETENELAFNMALSTARNTLSIQSEMKEKGLSDSQISALTPVIKSAAEKDIIGTISNYINPDYTAEQIAEMSGLIDAYINAPEADRINDVNGVFSNMLNKRNEFDLQLMLSKVVAEKDYNADQTLAIENALRSGITETMLEQLDNSFSAAEIEKYAKICNNAEYSDISNFIKNHNEQKEEKNSILRSYLTTDDGMVDIVKCFHEISLDRLSGHDNFDGESEFDNMTVPEIDEKLSLNVSFSDDGLAFSFKQMPDFSVSYSYEQINEFISRAESLINAEKAEKAQSDIDIPDFDKFVKGDSGITWTYYNPDGNDSNGQFVEILIYPENIEAALDASTEGIINGTDGTNEFFNSIYENCTEYLYDYGTPEFDSTLENFLSDSGVVFNDENKTNRDSKIIAFLENSIEREEPAREKHSIQFGLLGNGITIYDTSKIDPETNDYPTIAHISNEGNVTYYASDLSESEKTLIDNYSKNQKEHFTKEWYSLPVDERYSRLLEGTRHLSREEYTAFNQYQPDGETAEEKMAEVLSKFEKSVIFRDEEFPMPQNQENTFEIYQIKKGDEYHHIRFVGYKDLERDGIIPDISAYDKVYKGVLTDGMTIGSIYNRFNIDRPDDFEGHSLSVSDVIVINKNGETTVNYVDDIGFTQLDGFFREKEVSEQEKSFRGEADTQNEAESVVIDTAGEVTEEIPELTEKEQAFINSDINLSIAESVLSWDEIEDIGYRFFQDRYIYNHPADDEVVYGNGLSENYLYSLAKRMHDGEDISAEFAEALIGNTSSIITSNKNNIFIDCYEEYINAHYGKAEKQVSYKELGDYIINHIKNEFDNTINGRTSKDLVDTIPDMTFEMADSLIAAFDNAAIPDWQDNEVITRRIKKSLYDILGDKDNTEMAFASIADIKYDYADEKKQPDSLAFTLSFSENHHITDFRKSNPDFSFALANAIIGYLDEKMHFEKTDKRFEVLGYDKTGFEINAFIDGENFDYQGQFDIGSGDSNYTLLEHIEAVNKYTAENDLPEFYKPETIEQAKHNLEVLIPFLKANTQLTAEEEKIFADFKSEFPILTYDEFIAAEKKNLEPVTMRKNGDFYEMYGKNAQIAADVIGLTIMNKNGEAMVGFPDKIKDDYSEKLKNAGYSVLIEEVFELNKPERSEIEKKDNSEQDKIDYAIRLINEFVELEYEVQADVSDLSRIDIAYTTDEETGYDIQVYADLENLRIVKEYNRITVSEEKFSSLDEMCQNALKYLYFDELVSITDDEIASALINNLGFDNSTSDIPDGMTKINADTAVLMSESGFTVTELDGTEIKASVDIKEDTAYLTKTPDFEHHAEIDKIAIAVDDISSAFENLSEADNILYYLDLMMFSDKYDWTADNGNIYQSAVKLLLAGETEPFVHYLNTVADETKNNNTFEKEHNMALDTLKAVSAYKEKYLLSDKAKENVQDQPKKKAAPENTSIDNDIIQGDQLNLFGESVSAEQTVNKKTTPNTLPTMEMLEYILRGGSNEQNSLERIVAQFEKGKSTEENADFLRNEFGKNGKGYIYTNDDSTTSLVSAWFGENGIYAAIGDTAFPESENAFISWKQAADKINALLVNGDYCSRDVIERAAENEMIDIAKKLWNLRQDCEIEYFIPKEMFVGGFDESTPKIKMALYDNETLQQYIDGMADLVKQYEENSDVLRFHIYNPKELLEHMKDLQIERREFTAAADFKFEPKLFITEDEKDKIIYSRGSGVDNWKFRIADFFAETHTKKEKVAFLKQEYGIGGGGFSGINEWHDAKGIKLSKGDISAPDCTAIMKWGEVAERIERLIKSGRYVTQRDIDNRIDNAIEILHDNESDEHDIEEAKKVLEKYSIKIDEAPEAAENISLNADITRDMYNTENPYILDVNNKGKFVGRLTEIDITPNEALWNRLAENGLKRNEDSVNRIIFNTDGENWHKLVIPDKWGNLTNNIDITDIMTPEELEIASEVSDLVVFDIDRNKEITSAEKNEPKENSDIPDIDNSDSFSAKVHTLSIGDKFRHKKTGDICEVVKLHGALTWYTEDCTVKKESGNFIVTENVSKNNLLDDTLYEFIGNSEKSIDQPDVDDLLNALHRNYTSIPSEKTFDFFDNGNQISYQRRAGMLIHELHTSEIKINDAINVMSFIGFNFGEKITYSEPEITKDINDKVQDNSSVNHSLSDKQADRTEKPESKEVIPVYKGEWDIKDNHELYREIVAENKRFAKMAGEVIGNGKNPEDSVKALTEEFGFERTAWLTALNIAAHPLDGRFYPGDKEWACNVLAPYFDIKPDELLRQDDEKSQKFDRLISGGEMYSIHNTHIAQFAESLIPEYERYIEKSVEADKNTPEISNDPDPASAPLEQKSENEKTDSFAITDDNIGTGNAKEKFKANIAAIETLYKVESENRPATANEKKIMSKYVGWGGLSKAFENLDPTWSEEYTQLKNLLSDEEYRSASASTLDSFYTSPAIIESMYNALERFGFTGGNILEPSMGVGNFFGKMPEEIKKDSQLYGMEIDRLSGRMAKLIYPEADIQIKGFEKNDFQNDCFDIIVGNVPFGESNLNYDGNKLKIHDYFFAETIDKVKEGGIVALITSKGTLDKKDSSFRKLLSEKADLIGAVRLPNNAFRANAGTGVTSDIIFLQKRSAPPEIEPEWVNLGTTENGLTVNKYFIENPDMVLGTLEMTTGQYGRQEITCTPDKSFPLSEQLEKAMSRLSTVISDERAEDVYPARYGDGLVDPPEDLRNYSFFEENNNIYIKTSDRACQLRYDDKNSSHKRLKAFIELRDCTREVIAAQEYNRSDSEIQGLQKKLDALYDSFYKKYGLLHSNTNKRLFREDVSYNLVATLEKEFEKDKLIEKSDIFTKRTIKPARAVEHVDTAIEALTLSMAEKACVDFEYMESLTGISRDNLISDLQGEIYRVPFEGNTYQTASEYLSGDIRKKLNAAEMAAGTDTAYTANVKALTAVMPTPIKAGDIDIKAGATWIDPKLYEQFMYETFQTPDTFRNNDDVTYNRNKSKISVNYSSIINSWHIDCKRLDMSVTATKEFGTNKKNAYEIMEDVLNLRDPKVYMTITDKDGNDKRVVDINATKLAERKANKIRSAFKEWVFSDPERRDSLVDKYNMIFNSVRPREYDGSNLRFPMMTPDITLQEHQKNAVAHAMFGGNTLFAHTVGAGKTFEMIATAMESKRLGLCTKSLFAVPNHLTEQIGRDFMDLYPSANILIATKDDFKKENRQQFFSKVATGDFDAVIIGHSQLGMIPLSKERQINQIQDQINDITAGISDLKRQEGKRFHIKAMERTKKSLQEKLERLDKSHDDTVTFEEMGIDKLFVDEAHQFKNLFTPTKLTNVSGISSSASQKAMDLFMKCRYLDEKTGGKGVVFATGTPVDTP